MATRNTLRYGRKAGLFTALGFACGETVHMAYCILGFAALVAQASWVFTTLKYIGAAYLLWIGVKALRSKGLNMLPEETGGTPHHHRPALAAWGDGFFTNVFNPKAILFFFALFTQLLQPGQPLSAMLGYGVVCVTTCLLWFSGVALFLSHDKIRQGFLRFSAAIDKLCGACLVLLGLRMVLQESKP